ncbi:MAG: tetratricopeptide repeat protein, partial [Candidatus Omnitrophota bacterium]|nr:tetratricopeptide repeat protein [Candidatus Omnitrophota bacterium]
QKNWLEGVYAHHGNSLLELGENDKAIEVFEKLKTEAPQSPFAYQGLTTAYLRSNNMEKFIKNSEKLVELKPDVLSYYGLGQGYLAVKNYDKAKKNLLKAKELAESTSDTTFLQAIDAQLSNIPK